jgi:hypothetical protein
MKTWIRQRASRLRIAAWSVGVLAVILAVFAGYIYSTQQRQLSNSDATAVARLATMAQYSERDLETYIYNAGLQSGLMPRAMFPKGVARRHVYPLEFCKDMNGPNDMALLLAVKGHVISGCYNAYKCHKSLPSISCDWRTSWLGSNRHNSRECSGERRRSRGSSDCHSRARLHEHLLHGSRDGAVYCLPR